MAKTHTTHNPVIVIGPWIERALSVDRAYAGQTNQAYSGTGLRCLLPRTHETTKNCHGLMFTLGATSKRVTVSNQSFENLPAEKRAGLTKSTISNSLCVESPEKLNKRPR